jgi:hypothetical protein
MYTCTFNPEHILLYNMLYLGNYSNIGRGIDLRTIMNGECENVMWIVIIDYPTIYLRD